MYLYGYLLVGTAGIFAAMFGISQWLAGTRPWAFWILAALVFCALVLYIMAQFGQKLGARQTFLLHQEFESAIGRTVDIH
jgi:cell division protein FtsW (lipid II flippase)